MILHESIAFYSAFLNIHRSGVLTALAWLCGRRKGGGGEGGREWKKKNKGGGGVTGREEEKEEWVWVTGSEEEKEVRGGGGVTGKEEEKQTKKKRRGGGGVVREGRRKRRTTTSKTRTITTTKQQREEEKKTLQRRKQKQKLVHLRRRFVNFLKGPRTPKTRATISGNVIDHTAIISGHECSIVRANLPHRLESTAFHERRRRFALFWPGSCNRVMLSPEATWG